MSETDEELVEQDEQGLVEGSDDDLQADLEKAMAETGEEGEASAAGAEDPEASPEGDPDQPEEEKLEAPEHWAPGHREMFSKLDREAQQFLLDRKREMDQAHTQRSQDVAPFRRVAEEWQPYLQQVGMDPARAFHGLMECEYTLRTGTNAQKQNMLRKLAADYGISFEDPAEEERDDAMGIRAAVREEVGPLRTRVDELSGGFQRQRTAADHAAQAAIDQKVKAFEEEKTADGALAHPHFADVRQTMAMMAQAAEASGRPVDLAELYESACWSTKSVRDKLQGAAQAKAGGSAADKSKTARKKAASGGLKGGGAGGRKQEQPERSLEEELEAAWDQHAGAA